MRGYEISMEYFLENGFDVPVLVDKKDGLDLKIPPSTFRIQDVENYVGGLHFLLMCLSINLCFSYDMPTVTTGELSNICHPPGTGSGTLSLILTQEQPLLAT